MAAVNTAIVRTDQVGRFAGYDAASWHLLSQKKRANLYGWPLYQEVTHTSARLVSAQLEQLECIGPCNLQPVSLIDAGVVEPFCRFIHRLVGIIRRKHDPVGTNLQDEVLQAERVEIASSAEIKIGAQILGRFFLDRDSARIPGCSVIHTPDPERESLSQVAENYR